MKRISADTPNSVLLNVVRNNASLDYRNRIPVATQGNVREILDKLQSYRPDWNEFVEILLNVPALELYRAREIENPLARFKRAAIRPGSWVKEIGVGLVKAHSYDKDATNVFGRADADVRQNFHYQNRKDKYKISISEEQLAQAFYDESGLATFVNMLMMSLQNSDQLDEYLIMRDLIKQFDEENPIYNVQVPDFVHGKNLDGTDMTPEQTEQAGKRVARAIKSYGSKFRFANRAADYNPEGLPTISRNTLLICSSDFLAAFDTEVLAAAFNVDRVELWGQIVEVDDLGIEGAQALLVDEDWFVCVDTLLETRSAENPDGLFRNYFLHHWGIYSISRFLPAVLFSTRESTEVTRTNPAPQNLTFTDAPTSAIAGTGTRIPFVVNGADGVITNEGVMFEFVPTANPSTGEANVPTSTNTFVEAGPDGYAYLWVGSDETAPKLTVKGTCVDPASDGTAVSAEISLDIEGIEGGGGDEPTMPSAWFAYQKNDGEITNVAKITYGQDPSSIVLELSSGDVLNQILLTDAAAGSIFSANISGPGVDTLTLTDGPSGWSVDTSESFKTGTYELTLTITWNIAPGYAPSQAVPFSIEFAG